MATHATRLDTLKQIAAAVVVLVGFVGSASDIVRAEDPFERYDLAMFARPSLPQTKFETAFTGGLKELWLKALQRPDAEVQRLTIDTLAIAHRRGLEGMNDAKPRLLELLNGPDQRLDVLRALAQTLIVLDAREQAAKLSELSALHGLSIASIVEPALAQWKSPAMQKAWLQRVTDAEAGQTMMTFAIDGLGAIENEDASEPLQKIVTTAGETTRLRMSASRALGRIHSSNLVDLAQTLVNEASGPVELNTLMAIELLDQHDDPDAIALLTELAAHESTAVQSSALQRLFAIDFMLVDALADGLISSPDANVRRWCARAMIAKQSVGRIGPLATLLNDVNPGIRREVAGALIELAELENLTEEVHARVGEVQNRNEWRGCEQACFVLAKLDYKPSGERMVELLGHERGEVQVASAWGLTQLRIEALLPDMLDHAQSVYDGFKSNQLNDAMPGVSLHVGHLFIAFGDQRYSEAHTLMRKYLPKSFTLGYEARPAAAWALGMLYEDDPQDDLAKIMVQRMSDNGQEPEITDVQYMCAISLGRMKAESALNDLRKFAYPDGGLGGACYWSIERITGEIPPPIRTQTREIGGWYLEPIREEGS